MDTPEPSAPQQAPRQPLPPPAPTSASYTDSYGIASIILAIFMLTIPGLVVGLIGASKAKRLGVTPIVSRVGWIINLVLTVLFTLAFAAVVTWVVLNPDQISSQLSSLEKTTATTIEKDGASLQLPASFAPMNEEYPEANIAQQDTLSEAYVITYHDAAADIAPNASVTDYADASYRSFTDDEDYSNQTRTKLAAGDIPNPSNYDTADYRINVTYNGYQTAYLVRYIKTERAYYTIMTWTLPSRFNANEPRLRDIITSFREL